VLHLRLTILSVAGNTPVDNDVLFVIDFVNLKIKSIQYFEFAYKVTFVSIYVYTVFLKKIILHKF
jgi:hypothetical protein